MSGKIIGPNFPLNHKSLNFENVCRVFCKCQTQLQRKKNTIFGRLQVQLKNFSHKKLSSYCLDLPTNEAALFVEGFKIMGPSPKPPLKQFLFSMKMYMGQNCQQMTSKLNYIVNDNKFQHFIRLCIILNSLRLAKEALETYIKHNIFSMGIEHHNQPETLSRMVEISNLVFSFIFTVEMLMKVAALGIIKYISDGFNVFDGFLVCFG